MFFGIRILVIRNSFFGTRIDASHRCIEASFKISTYNMKNTYLNRLAISLTLLVLNIFPTKQTFAYLKYHPVSFVISTDKESYHEGEKITFKITITNTDKENMHPVLLPHTQNVGQKLFYLNLYDKANNSLLLRFTEDRMLKMMVHDTGSVQIRYLKPLEQIVIPIYLNDSENYFNYQTQNSSHHSFGVPLFAGVYKVNITYNPNGILLGDGIYNYYNDTDTEFPQNGKLPMYGSGQTTNFCTLKIKRSADSLVRIERQLYYIKTDGHRFFYFSEDVKEIVTDIRCHHITNLPADSFSIKGEYFYGHFVELYAEGILRFNDGDIKEYRKYQDYCPSDLYTEKYNDFKQKTFFATQLPDKRFYEVSYHQPGGSKHHETLCSADGTLCNVTTYTYNKAGVLIKTDLSQTSPCIEVEINGKSRSYTKMYMEGER